MAEAASFNTPCFNSPNFTTIKSLSESGITSIPSTFALKNSQDKAVSDPPEHLIPIIDFSLLISNNPQDRSKAIHDLGKACEEWGFFMVINHGIPENLINGVMEGIKGFFDLSEEEKREFQGKHVLDPVRCGSSFNTSVEKVHCWRDFLKVFVHPDFHFPHKPPGLSDIAFEYCKRIREVSDELLKGVSETLGLEPNCIGKAVGLQTGFQAFVANLYPPCPQPEIAMGMPPHSDHGLLTILTQNGINGLQTLHNGKWIKVNAPHNSLIINTADQLEIVTNGKYKSNVHGAALHRNGTRISLAVANGPSLDKVIRPAPELVSEDQPPAYPAITYKEYMEAQQSNRLVGKSMLDRIRVSHVS